MLVRKIHQGTAATAMTANTDGKQLLQDLQGLAGALHTCSAVMRRKGLRSAVSMTESPSMMPRALQQDSLACEVCRYVVITQPGTSARPDASSEGRENAGWESSHTLQWLPWWTCMLHQAETVSDTLAALASLHFLFAAGAPASLMQLAMS